MLVELNKQDLISLVVGKPPYYSVFENILVKKCGYYRGGQNDEWRWDGNELEKLSEKQLYNLYLVCRNSWKY